MRLYILEDSDGQESPHLAIDRKAADLYVKDYPGVSIAKEIDLPDVVLSSKSSTTRDVLQKLFDLSACTDGDEITETIEKALFHVWQAATSIESEPSS